MKTAWKVILVLLYLKQLFGTPIISENGLPLLIGNIFQTPLLFGHSRLLIFRLFVGHPVLLRPHPLLLGTGEYCIVHLGIIMIPIVLSLMSFNMAAPTRLKGGNAYILWGFQLKLKPFPAMQYGSSIQETYLSICLLRRVRNRSACELNLNLSHKVIKICGREFILSFCVVTEDPRHFVCHCVLYTRNAVWRNPEGSIKCKFPYTSCNIITKNRMHASLLLSVKIWTCLTLKLCLKHNFRANKMAFSSRTLIWFLSKGLSAAN